MVENVSPLQAPTVSMLLPAAAAPQPLPYVVPLQPQTGAYSIVQASGVCLQIPCVEEPQVPLSLAQ